MRWVRRWEWTKYVPICPTFDLSFDLSFDLKEVCASCTDQQQESADTKETVTGKDNYAFNGVMMEEPCKITKM